MKLLRNTFELLKEFVSLPRRLIFGIIGIWAFIWLSKEFGLYLLSEGREFSVDSMSLFRNIEFIANHFILLMFFHALWML